MDIRDYLNDDEEIVAQSNAREGDTSVRSGTLTCTPQRVVFTRGSSVIDIDTDRIDAIEYSASRYPVSLGIIALVFILAYFPLSTLTPLPAAIAAISPITGVIIGLIGFATEDSLRIHTGATSFKFTGGKGLDNFPGEVRRAADDS